MESNMSNPNLLCEYNLLKKIYGQNPLMMLSHMLELRDKRNALTCT